MHSSISILAAYTKTHRIIGSGGKIPWNLPSERNRFKQICKNKYILMGRKSFEEIGHSLPYCTIIIISKTMEKCPQGCILAKSLKEAVTIASTNNAQADGQRLPPDSTTASEILVAGGGEIYRQAMPYTSKIYATEIMADFPGDVTFPELEGEWDYIIEEKRTEFENKKGNISYEYVTYVRNQLKNPIRKADLLL